MFIKYYDKISKSITKNEDKKFLKDVLERLDKYIGELEKLQDPTNEERNNLFKFNKEEINHLFEITNSDFTVQIELWKALPEDFINNKENIEIFENVLENKFGEYISSVNKEQLVRLLNNSRFGTFVLNNKRELIYETVALLEQMNSPLFENPIALEVFSFEQLLEIVSLKKTENALKSIIENENSRGILTSIGKDLLGWQEKLQYLINLQKDDDDWIGRDKRNKIINSFGSDGSKIIQEELRRREEIFNAMERGYIDDKDYGIIDCDFGQYYILSATFGITLNEAKELIKKYGEDIDLLDIQTDDEKNIYRKLQIIKELTTEREFKQYSDYVEYYKEYYYSHKEELKKISKDVSPFYSVDIERSFLDLYARQYDRSLGVHADKKEEIYYDGKCIPVYEASGDFMMLIRQEQNVSPESKNNFLNETNIQVKGLCQNTISQEYIRTVINNSDNICFLASTSCKDGELRMASTTNIESKEANVELSNIGINSNWGNGIILSIPGEQISNSRGTCNETITTKRIYNKQTGLYERKKEDWIVYIQDTNDTDKVKDPLFKTALYAASKSGSKLLIIPREKYAQIEEKKIQELKEKLLGNIERSKEETDESLIKQLIVKFNNNREGILTSKGLKGKYFTEREHVELIGTINARLSRLAKINPEQYKNLIQSISKIYKDEIEKYYAYSFDRGDAKKELDINLTREHLKPYEDFLLEHERNFFNLSDNEKNNIYNTIKNISNTSYYDMNKYHSLAHIQKVVMFAGILAKNENLSDEETKMVLAAAAFHDSGRDGNEGENDNHALRSAELVKKYFEENPNNPFGIDKENISIIQAAIEYHEHSEQEPGEIDKAKIYDLLDKYGIDEEKFETLVKVSKILKDADALDRARFGKKNENRWSLNAKYLKTDTAKSISMLRFSEECNMEFEKREKQGNLLEINVEEIFESLLNEFNREKIQMSSVQNVTANVTVAQRKNIVDVLRKIGISIKQFIEEIGK